MTSKKLSNQPRRLALTLEARAGLIPESDWIEEEVRSRTKRGSGALAILEILADLRHYCDSKGIEFEKLDALACESYQDEASQSRMVRSLLN